MEQGMALWGKGHKSCQALVPSQANNKAPRKRQELPLPRPPMVELSTLLLAPTRLTLTSTLILASLLINIPTGNSNNSNNSTNKAHLL
jgi:hypothetical protein